LRGITSDKGGSFFSERRIRQDKTEDEREPLIVYTSSSSDSISDPERREESAMATKATGIERTVEVGPGESYKASDGLEGSGSMEMRNSNENGEEGVDEVVLERGIEALEGRGWVWYAYLMTGDFWLVLAIG
jgi:hypothetical protein